MAEKKIIIVRAGDADQHRAEDHKKNIQEIQEILTNIDMAGSGRDNCA